MSAASCRPVTEQVTGTGSWHPWCPDCGWSGRRFRAKTEAEAAAERHVVTADPSP